jgi:hypothetical protein
MKLSLWIFAFVTVALLAVAAQAQQAGYRHCTTTTSGSISHESCTFAPVVVQVQAPAVTVQPAAVTVTPQITVLPPAPKPAAVEPAKIRN